VRVEFCDDAIKYLYGPKLVSPKYLRSIVCPYIIR
jgi:hypothetical protein